MQDNKPSSKAICLRLVKYLKPYKRNFIFALVSMIIYGATDGIVPYILKRILDDVFGSRNQQMLNYLIIFTIIFSAIRGTFGFIQRYLSSQVGLAIVRDIRNEIAEKLLSLSSTFYQRQTSGNLITRVTNDTLLVRNALTDSAAAVLRDSVRVIALLIAAVYLDPTLAAIAFIGLPLCFLPIVQFGKRIKKLSRLGQEHFGGLTAILQEIILGHRVIQSFSKEAFEKERFVGENQKFTSLGNRAEKYGALSAPVNEIFASLAVAGVLLYGGNSVINGTRTQGQFIAFLTSMFLLYDPIKKTGRFNAVFQAGLAAAERIFEVLDEPQEIADKVGAIELSLPVEDIAYKNVWLSYQPDRWVLQDVSFNVRAGQTVALVGMSGGGKSSLVNLLPRFFDVTKGSVEINGIDIRNYKLSSLRESIAVVGQNTFLFNDTVFNNIAYGLPQTSQEKVYQAAKAANADEFISALPLSYQTVLGEQGMSLSGGQRARIAIARAILNAAPILILDEATASLDSESEGLVQEAIHRLMSGRTVFVIAHRLSTITEADLILVVSNGKVVESGTHRELITDQGDYSKLYKLQFKDDLVVNS